MNAELEQILDRRQAKAIADAEGSDDETARDDALMEAAAIEGLFVLDRAASALERIAHLTDPEARR